MSKRSIFGFVSVLLLVTWVAQCALIYFFPDLEADGASPWLVGIMFLPTIAALLYRLGFNRQAFAPALLRVGNPLYLIPAALIPAAVAMTVVAILLFLGLGYCEFFSFSGAGVEVVKGPWVLGLGGQSWLVFVANVAVTSMAFAAMNSVAAVGEEFGWRGFLQPHMIERFGLLRGVSLLGLVWAFWHLPANLAGYNYPDTPVLGAMVLFPMTLTAESFTMAWLTIRARSFWPAVVMHGSINGVQEGVLSKLVFSVPQGRLYADVLASTVALIVGAICLGLLLRSPWSNRTHVSSAASAS